MEVQKRKGAAKIQLIPREILTGLNTGELSSVNLVEWMAINRRILLRELLLSHNRQHYLNNILSDLDVLKKPGLTPFDETIGAGLYTEMSLNNDAALLEICLHHPADLVRSWAARILGNDEKLSLKKLFDRIQPLAADEHFIVREVAWIAIRHRIEKELDESISILSKWAQHNNANLRRFASESTRPRGVWCRHIDALKKKPELALPILEPMKSDVSKYVRDSVGNWLNDASKGREDFVISLCRKWKKESSTKETDYIVNRALRTLRKKEV